MSLPNTPIFDPATVSRTPSGKTVNTLGNKMAILAFAALTGCEMSTDGYAVIAFTRPEPVALCIFATWTEMNDFMTTKYKPDYLASFNGHQYRPCFGYLKAYEFLQTDADSLYMPFYVMGKPQCLPRIPHKISAVTLDANTLVI